MGRGVSGGINAPGGAWSDWRDQIRNAPESRMRGEVLTFPKAKLWVRPGSNMPFSGSRRA